MATTLQNHFQHTVQLTREWSEDLAAHLDLGDEQRGYRLLRTTLQIIRDWLNVNEAVQLGAQLPLLLRGAYYDGWVPAQTPVSKRSIDNFIARLDHVFRDDPIDDPVEAMTAVFSLLNRRISQGEVEDVRSCFPKDVRALWPAP